MGEKSRAQGGAAAEKPMGLQESRTTGTGND